MFSWLSEYDPFNSLRLNIILFHDLILTLLFGITVFISVVIIFSLIKIKITKIYIEENRLEFFWTLIPLILVLLIFFPSVFLLKFSFFSKKMFRKIVKVIGHQWNWEYNYSLKEKTFDFISSPQEKNNFRLLDTSGYVFVKRNTNTLFKITSDDVIHRFSLKELGIKVDAVPGRVKEFVVSRFLSNIGVFSGQCSEICGILHSNMPIVIIKFPF